MSRTLAITQNVSLDGSVEFLGDWFDPQGMGDVEDLMAENRRQDAAADALVVGRRTFLDFRGYWRDLEDDATGVADYLNAVAKYVVSATLSDEETEWEPTTVLRGDPVTQVRELKEQPGLDIVCTGSIQLCHRLISAGLVDEYRLFTYPAVQGSGRRLFPEGLELSDLKLLSAQAFSCGVCLTTYAAPGA